MECIVLAGGLGTRLQGVIGAIPKCMALVAGQPFLYHVFRYLSTQKCNKVILSLGFKHEMVLEWLPSHIWSFEIGYVIESEPLGTGGGIKLAMGKTTTDEVVILNGDTMFRVDLEAMSQLHKNMQAQTSLALKSLSHFERYGAVELNARQQIIAFEEKQYREEGWINGGVYIVSKTYFEGKALPDKCSFEKDYLEAYVAEARFYAYLSDAYFIDIGIPEDFEQAQSDFV